MIKRILTVIALGIAFGFVNFLLNPTRPTWGLAADEVSFEQIFAAKEKIVLVDARAASEFEKGHLEGALNLSEERFYSQLGDFLDRWNPEMKVYVYCSSASCNSSRSIAERLKNDCEIKNVYVVKGDWTKWKK